jgi:hypothetical protein
MREIIPSDTRYTPLTQQKWCCVPTCIQMVMLRHGIPLVPAELMGYHMGLTVPEKDMTYFYNPRTGEKPLSGYGTQAGKPAYGPNAVFRKLGVPLTMTWKLIDGFKSLSDYCDYLYQAEEHDNDILICYDWGTLFDDENYHNGHVCVLDKVFNKSKTLRFIDPDYYSPKWVTVSIEKLYEAMRYHGNEKSGGFWELHTV